MATPSGTRIPYTVTHHASVSRFQVTPSCQIQRQLTRRVDHGLSSNQTGCRPPITRLALVNLFVQSGSRPVRCPSQHPWLYLDNKVLDSVASLAMRPRANSGVSACILSVLRVLLQPSFMLGAGSRSHVPASRSARSIGSSTPNTASAKQLEGE